MTRSIGLRQYRACVRCRSRKTRCDLQSIGEPGKPPCLKCEREGADCVLAGSKRGGDYSRFRQPKKASSSTITNAPQQQQTTYSTALPRLDPNTSIQSPSNASILSTHYGDRPVHDNLQNPSDALLILANAAGQPEEEAVYNANAEAYGSQQNRGTPRRPGHTISTGREHRSGTTYLDHSNNEAENQSQHSYPPLQDGTLTIELLTALLKLYHENYHQFFPIVQKNLLTNTSIHSNLQTESFLLTSILVIASKDRVDLSKTHKGLWNYLRQRILDVILGVASTRQVGCVEGLLLLGEWNLVSNHGQMDDGGGEAAWSILGVAVRLAYRLRLEDAFRGDGDGDGDGFDRVAQRNRLAWTFTYLSDRQISIRMGQAFWCRGPGLAVPVTADDFPSLRPQAQAQAQFQVAENDSNENENEDLATWIQAQVELTTLFGNAHDILFPSKARTAELIMRGDYVKYIDDTNRAVAAWQASWDSRIGASVSRHLRSCLGLMREYLRLYVSAFAFQAVLFRASRFVPRSLNQGGLASAPGLDFPHSLMASPDARYIYDALDAAESLLKIFIEGFDAQRHLRYLPARFYLYEIHSCVFLFKAHASGAIPSDRYSTTITLITQFVTHLNSVTSDETHIATRYARLLQRLWFRSGSAQDRGHSRPGPGPGLVETGDVQPNQGALQGVGVVGPFQNCVASESGFGYGLQGLGSGNGNTNGNGTRNAGGSIGGGGLLDDIGVGISLEPFDYLDTIDGFLAMPPVFPYDLSVFFNGGKQ